MTYQLSFGTGDPGDEWLPMAVPFRSIEIGLAWMRHMTRMNPVDAYRLTEMESDRLVVMFVPAKEGQQ